MPSTRKNRPRSWQRRLLWSLGGILTGLLILLPLYTASLQLSGIPNPPPEQPGSSQRTTSTPPDPKESYQFYTLLTEKEVTPPSESFPRKRSLPHAPGPKSHSPKKAREDPAASKPRKTQSKVAQAEGQGSLLQIASFREAARARRLKGRVASLGLQARVVAADLPDHGIWFRVRLGPYNDLTTLNGVRRRLRKAGLNALVLTGGQ